LGLLQWTVGRERPFGYARGADDLKLRAKIRPVVNPIALIGKT
jgi:hypothetical protein